MVAAEPMGSWDCSTGLSGRVLCECGRGHGLLGLLYRPEWQGSATWSPVRPWLSEKLSGKSQLEGLSGAEEELPVKQDRS